MGRERTTAHAGKPLRFYIVGAPGTQKAKIARSLTRTHRVLNTNGMSAVPSDLARGLLADYRVEAALATDRAMEYSRPLNQPRIYIHSLIDSLAYSSLRYVSLNENGADQYTLEKWGAVTALIGALLRDTFQYDHVFFIEKDFEKGSSESDIQDALLSTVEAFGLSYSRLKGEYKDNLAAINQTIEAYLNEPGRDTTEPTE